MVEKIGPVKNPLTIIAIFAGLAETSGTVVLPFIEKNIQGTFVWFLIVFPIILIVLFFLTLNFNHKVLYAPSDYKDEGNFMKLFVHSTYQDKVDKLKEDLEVNDDEEKVGIEEQIETAETHTISNTQQISPENKNTQFFQRDIYKSIINKNIQATYLLAEELVLTKLSLELKNPVNRNLTFTSGSSRYKFDGIIRDDKNIYAIEVKYVGAKKNVQVFLSNSLLRIQDVYTSFEPELGKGFKLILAVVTNFDIAENNQLKEKIFRFTYKMPYHIDVRLYNLDSLKEEFGLSKT